MHASALVKLTAGFACGLAFAATQSHAQSGAYPAKPIRMVVAFPAGASSDIVGRIIGQKMAEQMGVQVLADNRPGAGGNLALPRRDIARERQVDLGFGHWRDLRGWLDDSNLE